MSSFPDRSHLPYHLPYLELSRKAFPFLFRDCFLLVAIRFNKITSNSRFNKENTHSLHHTPSVGGLDYCPVPSSPTSYADWAAGNFHPAINFAGVLLAVAASSPTSTCMHVLLTKLHGNDGFHLQCNVGCCACLDGISILAQIAIRHKLCLDVLTVVHPVWNSHYHNMWMSWVISISEWWILKRHLIDPRKQKSLDHSMKEKKAESRRIELVKHSKTISSRAFQHLPSHVDMWCGWESKENEKKKCCTGTKLEIEL